MIPNAKEFWARQNIGPNLSAFVAKHPNFADFWDNCDRADWMWWLIESIYDVVNDNTRDQLFYNNHIKYWEVFRRVVKQNKLREEDVEIIDNTNSDEPDQIDTYLNSLEEKVRANELSEYEARRRSWLGTHTWLLVAFKKAIEYAS